jgi:hypothetical protein
MGLEAGCLDPQPDLGVRGEVTASTAARLIGAPVRGAVAFD